MRELSAGDRDFLCRVKIGARLRIADRIEDKIRQKMRRAGFAVFNRGTGKWGITNAGRAALAHKGEGR